MGTNDAEDTTVDMNVTEQTTTDTTNANAVDGNGEQLGGVRRWIEALDGDPAVRTLVQYVRRHSGDTDWYRKDHFRSVTDRDEIHGALQTVVHLGVLERRVVDGHHEYRPLTNSPAVRACELLEWVYHDNLQEFHSTE